MYMCTSHMRSFSHRIHPSHLSWTEGRVSILSLSFHATSSLTGCVFVNSELEKSTLSSVSICLYGKKERERGKIHLPLLTKSGTSTTSDRKARLIQSGTCYLCSSYSQSSSSSCCCCGQPPLLGQALHDDWYSAPLFPDG